MTPRPPRGAKKRALLTAERLRDLYQAETELKYENPFQLLGAGFDSPGFAVDTHVTRLTNRIGLVATKDPVKIEYQVCAMVPKEEWTALSLRLILHGRRVCLARRPRCEECVLNDFCPSSLVRPGRRLGKGRPIGEAPGSDVKLAWR